MNARPFSPELELRPNAVTQKLAFLGISGSGKTYGAGRFVEWLLDASAQVVVIDTIGNWWGLRLGADGKRAGYSIPVIGGARGDVPLEATAGAQVAELVAESRSSMVVDVSDFTGGELRRFVTEFATKLLRAKKLSPSPVMLVWEECQDIVPQRVMGESAQMVGAVEKLIKKGRNYGVGTVLISQRPQAVNKDVLNQVETVFAFRTAGSQERKAIQEWIVHQSIDVGQFLAELPSLKTGTAFCWSPQWLNVLKRITVAKKTTFDASSTPEFGDTSKARELAPIDLKAFEAKMAATIERAKAFDPKALRQRIAELEQQVAKSAKGVKVERVEVPVLSEAALARWEKASRAFVTSAETLAAKATAELTKMHQALALVGGGSDRHGGKTGTRHPLSPLTQKGVATPDNDASRGPSATSQSHSAARPITAPRTRRVDPTDRLRRGAREMLMALASRHPTALTRDQVATLSGMSPGSGTFSTYLGEIRQLGYVEDVGREMAITDAGLAYLGPARPAAPQTTDELVALWSKRFRAGARAMLDVLVAEYPNGVSRAALGEVTGMSPSSGTFSTYLGELRRNGLAETGDPIRASSTLFLERS